MALKGGGGVEDSNFESRAKILNDSFVRFLFTQQAELRQFFYRKLAKPVPASLTKDH
jgi:hypothetical protein